MPAYKPPEHYRASPLLAGGPLPPPPPAARPYLAFFRGDLGERRAPHYSRGVRQLLHKVRGGAAGGW